MNFALLQMLPHAQMWCGVGLLYMRLSSLTAAVYKAHEKSGNFCRGDGHSGSDGFVSPKGTPDPYTSAPSECSCSHSKT